MKKIIFLLIMAVALIGFMPAMDTAHPPGDTVLAAAMFGDDEDDFAVTPDTVLAIAVPAELPAGIEAEKNYKLATVTDKTLHGYYLIKPT